MKYALAARGVGLALLVAFVVARPVLASADDGAKIDIVELRQSDASLQATYAKGKRMMLPRVLLLDAQGRALAVEVGMSSGIDHRLSVALKNAKPLDTPITLDLVLTEVVDKAGRPVVAADLPKGDAYIVDYWAEWCAPCRMLARDIQTRLHRWASDGRHVVWLKIESDPEKLPGQHKR